MLSTVLLLFAAVPLALAAGRIEPTSSSEWVSAHNGHRKNERAGDMQEMVWSKALADLASDYAKKCNWGHRPSSQRKNVGPFSYVGENLYAGTGKASIAAVLKSWVDEKKDYSYNTNKCTPGKMCGHYTQVVWANSCAVGCATAFCPMFNAFGRDAYFHVCNYGPGGNFNGAKPYKTGGGGLTKSQCSADGGGGGTTARNTTPRTTRRTTGRTTRRTTRRTRRTRRPVPTRRTRRPVPTTGGPPKNCRRGWSRRCTYRNGAWKCSYRCR